MSEITALFCDIGGVVLTNGWDEEARQQTARAFELNLEDLEARHAQTLAPIASRREGPVRLLVAAKIGKTRLIDNLGV